MARALQLELPARPTWGGHRRGAGRKLSPGRRPGVPHGPRPWHVATHPVHVTLRCVGTVSCLRARNVFPAVREALTLASRRGFRIAEFSVQENHIHLLVEADDPAAFIHGVRGLTIRVARA